MPRDNAGETFATARSLGITSGKKVVKDWLGASDKTDLYTFSLDKSSSIKLKLGKLKGNLNLELMDFQGNRVAHSSRPKTKKEVIRESLEVGTYYIKVEQKQGASKYKLKTILRELASDNGEGGADSALNPRGIDDDNIPPTADPSDASRDGTTKAERVALINQVLELTNKERTNVGLSELTLNPLLNNAAQSQSADLALNDFFSHTSPTGTTLEDRLSAANYVNYQTAGENIAAGQITATQVVKEWMNSPGHRANILNPAFTELGVGYYYLVNDTGEINYNRYWTQNFGTPMT